MLKRALILLWLMACLPVQAVNIIYIILDGQKNPITNHQCYIQPMSIPAAQNSFTSVAIGGKLSMMTDTNGAFTSTNPIVNCYWQCQVVAPPTQTPFQINLPLSLAGDTNTYYAAAFLNLTNTNSIYPLVIANATNNGYVPISTNNGLGYFWGAVSSSGGGSQTPATNNINLAGYSVTNGNQIGGSNIVVSNPATSFSLSSTYIGFGGTNVDFGLKDITNIANVRAANLVGNLNAGNIVGPIATGNISNALATLLAAGANISITFAGGTNTIALTGTVPTNNLPSNLAPLSQNNGGGLTNTVGFNTNTGTFGFQNTNVVVFVKGVTGFNTNWTWSASLGRYTNGGPYSIYPNVGDQVWYWTNGAGQYFYDSSFPQSPTDQTGFPYTVWVNGPDSDQSLEIGTNPAPQGSYQSVSSNTVVYTQTAPGSGPTLFPAGVLALSYETTPGNVIVNVNTNFPNSIIASPNNIIAGYNDFIRGGGGGNQDYGISDAMLGCSLCYISCSGGENFLGACETMLVNSDAGVTGSIGSQLCTNYAHTDCGFIGCFGGYIPLSANPSWSATSSYMLDCSGGVLFGNYSTLIGNGSVFGNSSVAIGNNNQVGTSINSLANNAQVFGNGLTNTAGNTVQVGIATSYSAYSNTTETVVGNIANTGTVVSGGGFVGSGASLTSLNGSSVSSGIVADARLSTNVPLLNAGFASLLYTNSFFIPEEALAIQTTTAETYTANTVYCEIVTIPFYTLITNIYFVSELGVASTGRAGFSIYAYNAGVAGARLYDTGAIVLTNLSTQVYTNAFTSTGVLAPGQYVFAFNDDSATCQFSSLVFNGGTAQIKGATPQAGTAANAATSGQNPTTLGAITGATITFPQLKVGM